MAAIDLSVVRIPLMSPRLSEMKSATIPPEATDFAGLVAWVTGGALIPGAHGFDMLWLLFRTYLPRVGGLLMMLARR
jgi:hypothetical protein